MKKKQKTEIGYKVVRVEKGRNYSCTGNSGSKRVIRYPLDIWVHPFRNCGPLAVFETITAAKDFIRRFFYHEIYTYKVYKCRYIPSKKEYLFIRSKNFASRDVHIRELPYGSKLARKVKIVKKCYEKKKKTRK